MSPFEIMYKRKCNTPIYWRSSVDRLMLGPILKYMELRVKQVQQNLKGAQDKQKHFTDLKINPS